MRIERQQQRIQRMNNYIERYFGPDVQIVLQSLFKPENQMLQRVKEKETFTESEVVEKDDITEEITLIAQEIEKPMQTSKMLVTWYTENLEHSLDSIQKSEESKEMVESEVLPTENAEKELTKATQTSELSLKEQQTNYESSVINKNMDALRVDLSNFNEPLGLDRTANYTSEQQLLWLSKATSPMGSARSMSTQSSTPTDSWELVPFESSPALAQHRVDIDEPTEKESHSKTD